MPVCIGKVVVLTVAANQFRASIAAESTPWQFGCSKNSVLAVLDDLHDASSEAELPDLPTWLFWRMLTFWQKVHYHTYGRVDWIVSESAKILFESSSQQRALLARHPPHYSIHYSILFDHMSSGDIRTVMIQSTSKRNPDCRQCYDSPKNPCKKLSF